MATFVSTGLKCYVGSIDLSGNLVSVAGNIGSELQDATTFGQTTRIRKGGLNTVQAQIEGYYEAADPDSTLYAAVNQTDIPVTIAPITGAVDERAFAFLAKYGNYAPGFTLGEMTKFSAEAESSHGAGLIPGYVAATGTKSSTGNTTGKQLGLVAAGQKLYAALHVLSFVGAAPTLDVVIQSDDNSGFTTATNRITFTQATAATSEWKTVSGAIADDDYWRVSYTLGGTITSATFAVFYGIQ